MRLSGFALLSSIYIKNNTNFFAITMIFSQYILKSIISFDPILFLNLILQQSNACFYHLYSYKRTVENSAFKNHHCLFFSTLYIACYEKCMGQQGEGPLVVQNYTACVQFTQDSAYDY